MDSFHVSATAIQEKLFNVILSAVNYIYIYTFTYTFNLDHNIDYKFPLKTF